MDQLQTLYIPYLDGSQEYLCEISFGVMVWWKMAEIICYTDKWDEKMKDDP